MLKNLVLLDAEVSACKVKNHSSLPKSPGKTLCYPGDGSTGVKRYPSPRTPGQTLCNTGEGSAGGRKYSSLRSDDMAFSPL